METLGSGNVTFFKFKAPGDTVAGLFESAIFDAPSKYGKESSIRVSDEEGNITQARMSASLVSVIKGSLPRLQVGKSKLIIKYTGDQVSKKDPSKSYKAYDVQADNLLPKGLAGAKAILESDSTPPAGGGDASFDPSKLK
jgi:hypothetical protein